MKLVNDKKNRGNEMTEVKGSEEMIGRKDMAVGKPKGMNWVRGKKIKQGKKDFAFLIT